MCFVKGGQYAVSLALIVNGEVQLGVIGCPCLPVDLLKEDGPRGCIFVAIRGQGAEQVGFVLFKYLTLLCLL